MHCRQVEKNYCIPACVVMIETWRGNAPANAAQRQHQVFERLKVGSYCTIDGAANFLGAKLNQVVNPDPNAASWVAAIAVEQPAIATCWAGNIGRLMWDRGLRSQLGPPNSEPLPHHAIVIRTQGSEFEVFDPWFDSDGQPVVVTRVEFARIWTGHIAVFGRLAAVQF
jgi:hypothetical protein